MLVCTNTSSVTALLHAAVELYIVVEERFVCLHCFGCVFVFWAEFNDQRGTNECLLTSFWVIIPKSTKSRLVYIRVHVQYICNVF